MNKLVVSAGVIFTILISTLALTTASSRCTEGWKATDTFPIYYCESKNAYIACDHLSSTKVTCYHIKELPQTENESNFIQSKINWCTQSSNNCNAYGNLNNKVGCEECQRVL